MVIKQATMEDFDGIRALLKANPTMRAKFEALGKSEDLIAEEVEEISRYD